LVIQLLVDNFGRPNHEFITFSSPADAILLKEFEEQLMRNGILTTLTYFL